MGYHAKYTPEFKKRAVELTLREVKHTKRNDALGKLRTVDYKERQSSISAHVKGRGSKKGDDTQVEDYRAKHVHRAELVGVDDEDGKIAIAHCGEYLRTYDTSSL